MANYVWTNTVLEETSLAIIKQIDIKHKNNIEGWVAIRGMGGF